MHKQYQNYIFDLDGTIINSSEEILSCLKKSYKKLNYPIDETKFTPDIIGPPIKNIVAIVTPEIENEKKIEDIIFNFRQIYDNNEKDVSTMYNGVFEYLTKLKSENKKIFIATFKPKIPTMRLVKKFGLDMFENIYTVDKFDKPITKTQMIEHIIIKYHLNKDETVMLGDTKSDMVAANENNITGIGVLWGYGKDKTALKQNATAVINNITEL